MMKALSTILALIVLALASTPSGAQTLVNNGALIHVAEKALVTVNGNTVNIAGDINVRDSATVQFNGSVDIRRGGLHLYANSLAVIAKDLTISLQGACWRYRPGSLIVEGTIANNGELVNEGEIVIGRP